MHDDLNICTDDPWRSLLLSESGPHLTVATIFTVIPPEPVITNNLTRLHHLNFCILLFSHPHFFNSPPKIFFKTPVLQSIDPTTFSLFFTNLESVAHHYTLLFEHTLDYLVPSSPIITTRQTPNLDKSYRHLSTQVFFNSADWTHYIPKDQRQVGQGAGSCNHRPFLYSPEWLLLMFSH